MRHPHPNRFSPAPLALAAAIALGLPALAQAQAATGARPVAVSIAAQSLGDALNELAAAVGTPIAFSQALVAGKTSPAVKGTLTARQALDRLLVGSGLVGLLNGGVITVQQTPKGVGDAALPEVKVTAEADRSGTTEGIGTYTTRASSTATKLDLSLRETPQTVTVVTHQKMRDFGLTNVETALESTSTTNVEYRGIPGSEYYVRGFAIQSQYDGMPNPLGIGQSDKGPTLDTAFLDRIEILSGASGLMTGAGDPGGTVNLIRKRPTDTFQANVETQLGSWGKRRLVGDISGPLIESGRLRGRAVALVDNSNSFKDYTFNDRNGFYGVLEADLTDTTTLGASVMYQRNKLNEDEGVPMAPDGSDLRLPRSTFLGHSNGRGTRENKTYSLDLKQKLPSDWTLKATYTHSANDNHVTRGFLIGDLDRLTGDGLLLLSYLNQRKLSSNAFDIYASGPLELFDRKHEFAFGATHSEFNDKSRNSESTLSDVNIYNGSPLLQPNANFPENWEHSETRQTGAYGVAKFNLTDSLKIITGVRLSSYKFTSNQALSRKESSVVSPYAGLVYDLNDNYTVYVSYSDIFKPQSNMTIRGTTLDPISGKNYEIGIKGEFFQGRLNTSAAVFQLRQSNLPEIDRTVPEDACAGNPCFNPSSLVVSEGIDLAINGEIASGWQIGAAYTYVDSKYKKGADQGKIYNTTMPKSTLRAYTTYRIPSTNWTIGGDLRVQSNTYSEDTGWKIEQGGYTLVGLMAKYQINKKTNISMSANNIFNKRYYRTVYGYGTTLWNFYGNPRNIQINLKHDF